ncbi:ATP12-domain-containing protein [Apiospora aurea]|uniref:ATP12-domain-containing protein n=1 Tax=Apiospora aurea TaxID=335848 RepID=A0ABR1QRG0_9PEZI
MRPSANTALRLASSRTLFPTTPLPPAPTKTTTGPRPSPPSPAADNAAVRLARRKKQAELLRQAADIRKSQQASSRKKQQPGGQEDRPRPRRFWKDVSVKEVDGALQVHLDARPLRHPGTKAILRLPLSKPMLAGALALEWDQLTSVQQATKHHLIPLTSLVCRAIDIAEDDEVAHSGAVESLRAGIAKVVMRYLDTDTMLCFAPPPASYDVIEGKESLRETQQRAYQEIVGYLTSRVWPGVEIEPVLDGDSLMPKSHSEATRAVVEGWVTGLSAWELAGLERGVLAGKGLLGAVRLVVEWSEDAAGLGFGDANKKFGVEEAAKAASLEVDWQIGNWGEVEDTHDVEKEDLRRQLGSVVLLVSGTGMKSS